MPPSALRRRVLLSGTMLAAAVGGYGRRAYAACVNSGGSTYQCSGANAATQAINANNASVSTIAGFSVNAAAGNAITITGAGALSYTDTNASQLTAATGYALYARASGDFGGTPGSVTINTNGALSGTNGIRAHNSGTGAVTITANGNVTATTSFGIYANNFSPNGTNLTVTTAAGITVSGTSGIFASNAGTGALTITANGNVTGTSGTGIDASTSAIGISTNLTVTTAAGSTVSGDGTGISSDQLRHWRADHHRHWQCHRSAVPASSRATSTPTAPLSP